MRLTILSAKWVLLIFSGFSLPLLSHARSDSSYKNYIQRFHPLALSEQQRTGIPASIKLAQGLLESNAGEGDLVKRSNNHFGIKCKKDWTGEVAYHDDDARGECFRAYPSAEASYADHSNFLKANSRYASLFQLEVTDYKGWAEGLKKAGYATNPKYTSQLIRLIEESNLHQYTLLALERKPGLPETNPAIDSAAHPSVVQPPVRASAREVQPPAGQQAIYPPGYFFINGTRALFAKAGSSLLAIADQHHLPLASLLDFNDMHYTLVMPNDAILYLESKPRKGLMASTKAAPGESLWQIGQRCGVRLKSLKTYNGHLTEGVLPAGTTVQLQPTNTKSRWLAKK